MKYIVLIVSLMTGQSAFAGEQNIFNETIGICDTFLFTGETNTSKKNWERGDINKKSIETTLGNAITASIKNDIWIAKDRALVVVMRSDYLNGTEVYRECTVRPVNPKRPKMLGGLLKKKSGWEATQEIQHKVAKNNYLSIFSNEMVEINALDMGLSKAFAACANRSPEFTVIYTAFYLFNDFPSDWVIKGLLLPSSSVGICD